MRKIMNLENQYHLSGLCDAGIFNRVLEKRVTHIENKGGLMTGRRRVRLKAHCKIVGDVFAVNIVEPGKGECL